MTTCPKCKGEGIDEDDNDDKCSLCDGTGEVSDELAEMYAKQI